MIINTFEIILCHNKLFTPLRIFWNASFDYFILVSVFVLDEPSAFYAEEIYAAVEGLGTKDTKLQQIFVQRSEVKLFTSKCKFFEEKIIVKTVKIVKSLDNFFFSKDVSNSI